MSVVNSPAIRTAVEYAVQAVKDDFAKSVRNIEVTSAAFNAQMGIGVGIGIIRFLDGERNFTVFTFGEKPENAGYHFIIAVYRFANDHEGHARAVNEFTRLEQSL